MDKIITFLGGNIIKGVLNALGKSIVKAIMNMTMSLASPEFMQQILSDILQWYVKSTKTTVDDELMKPVIAQLKKSGVIK